MQRRLRIFADRVAALKISASPASPARAGLGRPQDCLRRPPALPPPRASAHLRGGGAAERGRQRADEAGDHEPRGLAVDHAARLRSVRRAALLTASIFVFGAGVDPLGLVPALLVTTFLAGLADRDNSVLAAAVIAVGLTAACVVIFVLMLQLRLPLIGSMLGG